jgi:hypothetical protein
MKVYAPTGRIGAHPSTRAASIPVLAGRRIGVLDNGKPNARLLLERAAMQLAARTGATVAVVSGKGGTANAATPADEAALDRLSEEVDLVLTGSAD